MNISPTTPIYHDNIIPFPPQTPSYLRYWRNRVIDEVKNIMLEADEQDIRAIALESR